MKKVVIISEPILPIRLVTEYCKRKSIDVYTYIGEVIGNKLLFELKNIEDIDDINKPEDYYRTYYLSENVGDTITSFTDEIKPKIINEYELLKDREDSVLIDVAEEINNPDIVKVVEIPDNVEYYITQIGDSSSEYIVEKHRIWSFYDNKKVE